MIVIGYPGIGKSTMSGVLSGFVDLESSNFRDLGERWYVKYVDVGFDLHRQGFSVLLSSHREVVDFIGSLKLKYGCQATVVVCFPDVPHKDWEERLEKRYLEEPSDKNRRAYERVSSQQRYLDDVCWLASACKLYGFTAVRITDLDYDLRELILRDAAPY